MVTTAGTTGSASLPRALLILLIVSTLVRLVLAAQLDLGQDEAYAVAVSRPFQLSFFDHPPLSFWMAGATQALFGRNVSPLLLRLPFVLLFTGSTWALYALTARAYSERAGLWAAGLMTTAPFFIASAGGWVVPDGPLVFFLLLAALSFQRVLAAPAPAAAHWRGWLLTGIFLGLALLSKYQGFLILFGAFCLLFTRPHRFWLARPQPYVAALLALLIFLPALVWNFEHDWVSFGFQLGRGSGASGVSPGRWAGLVLTEAAYLLPWTFIGLIVAAIAAWRRRTPFALLFMALGLPAILLFNLQPLLGSAGKAHWSMPGWLFLFPLLGLFMADLSSRAWRLAFGWLSVATISLAAVGVLLFADSYRLFAGLPGMSRFMTETATWSGVRDDLMADGLLDRPGTFLAATNWAYGARLAEAVRPADPIVPFSGDPRGFAFIADPAAHLGEDAVFVVPAADAAAIAALAPNYFDSIETIATRPSLRDGVPAFTYTVLLAHRLIKPYPLPYGSR